MNVIDYPKWSDIFYGTLSGVFLFGSIFIHVLTLIVITRSRRLQSTTNYFLINLSVLGILSSLPMVFVIVNSIWKFLEIPSVLCKIVPTFSEMIMCDNQVVLVSISIDRYYTLTQPLNFKITKFQTKKMIVLGILFSVVISFPFVYLFDTKITFYDSICICMVNVTKIETHKPIWIYLSVDILLNFVIPFIIIIAAYIRICTYTWTFGRQGIGARFLQRTSNNIQRSKVKVLKILVLISVVDLFSMMIITILKLLHFLSLDKKWNAINIFINILFYSLLINPVLYITLNTTFRRGFKEILCWSKRHYYRTQAYSVTTITAIAKRNYISNYDIEEIGNFKQRPKNNLFEVPNESENKNKFKNDFEYSYENNYFDNIICSDNDLKLLKTPISNSSSMDRSNFIKY